MVLILFFLLPTVFLIGGKVYPDLADAARIVWVVWVSIICLRALLLLGGAFDEPDARQHVDLTPLIDNHRWRAKGTISMRRARFTL
jgi:hypothetical protein